jgi:sirohydrochlorin ferrochelatase
MGSTIKYGAANWASIPRWSHAAGARVREAIAKADAESGPVALHDTCLVRIGRGASDIPTPMGTSQRSRAFCTRVWGTGWVESDIPGVTFRLWNPASNTSAKLGYKRIVVFPYFLFTGILIDRIYGFNRSGRRSAPGHRLCEGGLTLGPRRGAETHCRATSPKQLGAHAHSQLRANAPTGRRCLKSREKGAGR